VAVPAIRPSAESSRIISCAAGAGLAGVRGRSTTRGVADRSKVVPPTAPRSRRWDLGLTSEVAPVLQDAVELRAHCYNGHGHKFANREHRLAW
jgi:hypothetical protein